MHRFKTLTIVVIILGVGINCEDMFGNKRFNGKAEALTHKQRRSLKRLLRFQGNHNFLNMNSVSNRKYKNDEAYHNYENDLPYQNLNKFTDNTKISPEAPPQISITSNDKVIFTKSFDLAEHQKFKSDASDSEEYNDQYDDNNFLENKEASHTPKVRRARSVTRKGQLLASPFRRINRDPEKNKSVTNENDTLIGNEELSSFESILSTGADNSNNDKGNSNITTVSEEIHTPSNNGGGVTKVEINLSFGCLFFCE